MNDFIPPFPHRPAKTLGPLELIKHAQRDMLSIWPEQAFDRQFVEVKLFKRSLFIVNHPDVVRHVLIGNAENYSKKHGLLRKALQPLLGEALFINDDENRQQRRHFLEASLQEIMTSSRAGIVQTAVEDALQRWSAVEQDSTVPLLSEMRLLMLDIISRMLFGRTFDRDDAALLMQFFDEYMALAGQLDLNSFFGMPSWLPGGKSGKLAAAAKALHALLDNMIAQCEKQPHEATLLNKYLRAEPDSDALDRQQLRNELIMLLMAGHEMSANTLAWACYLLSKSPRVEQCLHAELDRVFGTGQTTADSVDLPYARAIVEETMRLFPPLPLLAREAAAGDTIRKRPVAAGSVMLIVPWLLHRHKQYWEKPDHFMPERFLNDADKKSRSLAYIPFGAGPKACLAQEFAMDIMTQCLAMLARRFSLRLPDEDTVGHEWRLTLRPKNKLPMYLVRR